MMRIIYLSCFVLVLSACATRESFDGNLGGDVIILPSSEPEEVSVATVSAAAEGSFDSRKPDESDPVEAFLFTFVDSDNDRDRIKRNVDYYRALADLLWQYPDDARLVNILGKEPAPLVVAALMVQQRFDQWLNAPVEVDVFIPPEPELETITPPILVRGEFESTVDFNARYQQATRDYEAAQTAARVQYKQLKRTRQQAVERKKRLEDQQLASRKESRDSVYQQLLGLALPVVLGDLFLDSANYDADANTLFVLLTSTRAKVNRNLSVTLSPGIARQMVQQLDQVSPYISIYENQDGALVLGEQANLVFAGQEYSALAIDYVDIPELVLRRVK